MAYNAFAEWTKLFGDFKTPSLDNNQLVAQMRRNAEAAAAVAQIVTKGMQEAARHHAATLRSNAEHALRASKELVSNSTQESAAAKHADFTKNWIEYNVNSARELVELGTRSAQEVFEVVNKHISEQVKEFSEVAASNVNNAKKKAA